MSCKNSAMKTKCETSFTWTQEKINDLISLYQANECLWNVSTEDYKSREKRDVAISSICNTLYIKREQFSKKIHNLRNQFNYEAKKVYQRNDHPKNSYRSKWEYYDKLLFLKNVIAPRPGPNYVLSDYEVQNTNNIELINIENEKSDKTQLELSSIVESKVAGISPDIIYNDTSLAIQNNDAPKILNSIQKPLTNQPIDKTSQQLLVHQIKQKNDDQQNKTIKAEKRQEISTRSRKKHISSPLSQKRSEEHENTTQHDFILTNSPPKKIIKRSPSFGNYKNVQSNQIKDSPEQRDEYDLFGEFVASELRNLDHEISRKKLRRRIMRAMLDTASEDDDLG